MIRKLQSSEVGLCIEGGGMFSDEGKLPGGFIPEVFRDTWMNLIDRGIGVIFGSFGDDGVIHGALGAVKCPDPFNGDLICVENFWYVIPEYRGSGIRLLKQFEAWAKEQGAKRVAMIHLLQLSPKELEHLYIRLGYQPIEVNYIKNL